MAKILLVDDAIFALNMLVNMIENGGHHAVRAADGKEGLVKIEEEKPDLVITDLLMPNLDGLSFLQAVQETHPELPVMVMSANIQKSVRQQCLDAGASEFMHKPPDSDELMATIEGLL